MFHSNLSDEETEVFTSEDETEKFFVPELNYTDNKKSEIMTEEKYQYQKSNKNSSPKTISKFERNCTFSIDSILGQSNKLHKNHLDIPVVGSTTSIKKISENQTVLSEGNLKSNILIKP